MNFPLELWNQGPYRAAAKIASNLLALRNPRAKHQVLFRNNGGAAKGG